MATTYFGLDVKTAEKVVLWTHLIENVGLYVFSLVMMVNYMGEAKRFQSVQIYQDEIANHMKFVSHCEMTNFGAIFSLIGASASMFCLIIEKSKVWKFLWLVHQGISVELLLIICMRMVWSEEVLVTFVITVIPAITFLLLKTYSWFVVLAAIKQLKTDEKKKEFAAQWITNSIIGSPYARLTFPAPDLIPTDEAC